MRYANEPSESVVSGTTLALLGKVTFNLVRPQGFISHGRNAGHPAPPAQTRTCGFPASGSSVGLASVRTFTVTRYKIQLLFPAVRLARVIQPYMSGTSFLCGLRPSVRSFPLHAWCTHACGWLSQPLSTMPDKTPQWHIAALRRPTCVVNIHQEHNGASRVLQRISSCMPRPDDSGGPPHPRQ